MQRKFSVLQYDNSPRSIMLLIVTTPIKWIRLFVTRIENVHARTRTQTNTNTHPVQFIQ